MTNLIAVIHTANEEQRTDKSEADINLERR
jgi:hypothetical protein